MQHIWRPIIYINYYTEKKQLSSSLTNIWSLKKVKVPSSISNRVHLFAISIYEDASLYNSLRVSRINSLSNRSFSLVIIKPIKAINYEV